MARMGCCPTCKKKVSENAESCPSCGEPLGAGWMERAEAERKKKGATTNKVFLVIAAVVVAVVWLSSGSEGPETEAREAAAQSAKEAEERRKGFHCLSAWDGSHSDVKAYVEERMRDPDSFEHIETRITPVKDDGTHTLVMKYRAKNGFGGMTVGEALATVRNSNCRATVLAIN